MDEAFIKKIRAAAVAGWWTLLIAYILLLIQWFAYLLIMSKQLQGMLCLWGGEITWPEIRSIWLWGMAAYKLIVGAMLFVVIWLTLWARQMAKK